MLAVALAACGVQSSAPFSGTQTGDVTVALTGDLAGITKLDGNLTVHPAPATTILTLPDLTAVTGSVTIEGLDGTYKTGFTLSLPALTSAGLDVVVQQTGSAVTLDLPALTAISGHTSSSIRPRRSRSPPRPSPRSTATGGSPTAASA